MEILLRSLTIMGEISSSNLSIRINNENNATSYDECESFLYITIQIIHVTHF